MNIGITVSIATSMEVAIAEERIKFKAASPVVGLQSSKIAIAMDSEVLKNIPLASDHYDIMTAAPGSVSEGVTYRKTYIIQGTIVRGKIKAFDGMIMDDTVVIYTLINKESQGVRLFD